VENLHNISAPNFLRILPVKEFLKSVYICHCAAAAMIKRQVSRFFLSGHRIDLCHEELQLYGRQRGRLWRTDGRTDDVRNAERTTSGNDWSSNGEDAVSAAVVRHRGRRPLGIGVTACPDLTKLYAAGVLSETMACFQRTAQLRSTSAAC